MIIDENYNSFGKFYLLELRDLETRWMNTSISRVQKLAFNEGIGTLA